MDVKLTTMILAAALAAAPIAAVADSAPPPPNPNPAAVPAGTYSVEPYHTRVLFSVSHLGLTTWYGEFTQVSGSLSLDPKALGKSGFDIIIPAKTISTSNTKLDGELNSPEWFDTAKYPTIEFKSLKVKRTGKDTARVTGELTFHGVTKPETLNVTFNAAGINPITSQYTVGFNATGEIKRSDFDQKTYIPMIGDEVTLIISAAFVK
jgi:polyisoprenoid-binding protein YceI